MSRPKNELHFTGGQRPLVIDGDDIDARILIDAYRVQRSRRLHVRHTWAATRPYRRLADGMLPGERAYFRGSR